MSGRPAWKALAGGLVACAAVGACSMSGGKMLTPDATRSVEEDRKAVAALDTEYQAAVERNDAPTDGVALLLRPGGSAATQVVGRRPRLDHRLGNGCLRLEDRPCRDTRVVRDHVKQRQGAPPGPPDALLPVAKRGDRKAEPMRESRLAESQPLADCCDVDVGQVEVGKRRPIKAARGSGEVRLLAGRAPSSPSLGHSSTFLIQTVSTRLDQESGISRKSVVHLADNASAT